MRLDVEPASSFAAESLKSVDMQKMAAENVLDVQEIFQKPVSVSLPFCVVHKYGKDPILWKFQIVLFASIVSSKWIYLVNPHHDLWFAGSVLSPNISLGHLFDIRL